MARLVTDNLWREITLAANTATNPAYVAVAYFADQGPNILPLPSGSTLVVDATIATVQAGATSPAALERLLDSGVSIFSAQHLHAKVFAFETVGFVGSCNASIRSADTLVEAALRVDTTVEIADITNFVKRLAVTDLNKAQLRALARHYRAPTFARPPRRQRFFSTLLMELTSEQGLGRETQVQPPRPVWEHFFGVDLTKHLPTLYLHNRSVSPQDVTARRVVSHHHVYTIEISGAGPPRPAIIEMRWIGRHRYSYVIYRPPDPQFAIANSLLDEISNPYQQAGRRWTMI